MFKGISRETLLQHLKEAQERGRVEVHGIVFAVQNPETKSVWAQMVRKGLIKANSIVWAFIEAQNSSTGKTIWMGILLDTGKGREKFFDLRDPLQRTELKKIENQCRMVLNRTSL